jgi:purine nucleosidase
MRAVTGRWPGFAATILDASNETYQHVWGRRVSATHGGLAAVILHRPDIDALGRRPCDLHTHCWFLCRAGVARTYDGNALTFETVAGQIIRAATDSDEAVFLRLPSDALMYGRH